MTQLIKQMAVEAYQAERPSDVILGTVVGEKPLKIKVSQKLILSEEFLILTSQVCDYETIVTITDGISGAGHSHTVSREKTVIHNVLKKGDQVVMIRQAGGQRYLVIDKVVKA